MRIALIGFMGSGKSTVSRLLGSELSFPVIELDEQIIALSSCSKIPEIFDRFGEEHFRDLESEAIAKLPDGNLVLSPGGGVIERDENCLALRRQDFQFVYLWSSFAELVRRVGNADNRPLFRDRVMAEELYRRREPVYEQWADVTFNSENLSPALLVEMIKNSCGC